MSSKSMNRILGIDPGTNVMGYAILDAEGEKLKLETLGVIKMKRLSTHHEKLQRIMEKLQMIITQYMPHCIAIEAPFYGKNPQSMLKLGRAQGVAIAVGMTNNIPVTEYSPKKIKLAITGNGNASKEQVSAMLPHLVLMDKDISNLYLDATDALATAVCLHFQSSHLSSNVKQYSDWSDYLSHNDTKTRK